MLRYIIEVVIFQSIFLGAYLLFLRRETFFQYNRAYLLGTAVLAFALPFLEFDLFRTQMQIPLPVQQLPAVFIGSPDNATIAEVSDGFSTVFYILFIYGAGVLFGIWKFAGKYAAMQRFFRFKRKGDGNIINIPNSDDAFTFVNTVFLGENIDTETREHILAHELVHVKQRHSLDLFFFELLRVVFWFNPMIYAYQKTIAELHEFIADAKAMNATETKSYYNGLLNMAFGTQKISFINTFFNHSLIKKRIVMLHKHSKTTAKWKYLLLIPIFAGILAYEGCSSDNNPVAEDGQTLEQQIQDLQATIDTKESLTNEEREMILKLTVAGYKKAKANGIDLEEKVVGAAESHSDDEVIDVKVDQDTEKNVALDETVIPDVPYAVVEQVPTYPGCEELAGNQAKKDCMSSRISEFVNKNFNTELGKKLGLTGINKIYVQFKIDANGNVQFMGARAPRPELEKEAERVVNLLPHMSPGIQRGKPVNVLYALPIVFQVQE